MKLIAIDTSTEYLSLGVSEDKKILFAETFLLERRHSTDLLPILDKTLKRLKLSIEEFDGFIVGLGPGSFTGLRVGISMVKAMALALDKPIVGVPTLDCLAASVKENGLPIAPLVDAKRQQVYAALYEKRNSLLQKKMKEKVIPPDLFLKTLKGKTLFIGGGARLYKETIQKAMGKNALFGKSAYDVPDPETLVRLGGGRFEKREFVDLRSLVPLYIYPKDCMIKKVPRGDTT